MSAPVGAVGVGGAVRAPARLPWQRGRWGIITPASCSSYLSAPLMAKPPPDDEARGQGSLAGTAPAGQLLRAERGGKGGGLVGQQHLPRRRCAAGALSFTAPGLLPSQVLVPGLPPALEPPRRCHTVYPKGLRNLDPLGPSGPLPRLGGVPGMQVGTRGRCTL